VYYAVQSALNVLDQFHLVLNVYLVYIYLETIVFKFVVMENMEILIQDHVKYVILNVLNVLDPLLTVLHANHLMD
jgi:hypothetical protein